MKHFFYKISILIILSVILLELSSQSSYALTASPTDSTPVPTKSPLSEKINELKDRIASRVAQLKLVERKGTIGTVTEVTDTQISLSDLNNNIQFVDVDEITKFSNPTSKDSFGISDIKKGHVLGVLGLYNKQSRRILARFITLTILPKFIHATVISTNSDDFTLKVQTTENRTVNIDVETITKTVSYAKGATTASKAGFSKITAGQHVLIVGFPNKKDPAKIIASRIVLFPDLPQNPAINLPVDVTETVVPSTGSGKKVTPLY